jgi:putative SOS response-associated peptidase YedK
MPSPAFALEGKKSDPGVTNIRNTKSPHWRRWLGVENRCVVPFTSFAEPEPQPVDGRQHGLRSMKLAHSPSLRVSGPIGHRSGR